MQTPPTAPAESMHSAQPKYAMSVAGLPTEVIIIGGAWYVGET